jgi:hypothetical protein
MKAAAMRKFGELSARAGEALWPGIVTIAGKDYEATAVVQDLVSEYIAGGQVEDGELLVRLRKDLLAEKPALKTELLHGGKKWKVEKVEGEEEASAVWVLKCERKK